MTSTDGTNLHTPRSDSLVNRWTPWYCHIPLDSPPRSYGTSDAYRLGAEWLKDCTTVQDWGCGLGYMRNYIPRERYLGIDGTPSPFVDVIADLVKYRSMTAGIFMRGVLEHNHHWRDVLGNSLQSFTQRMCIVLFTPMATNSTRAIAYNVEIGVPDISFLMQDLVDLLPDEVTYSWMDIRSDTAYGGERLIYLERPQAHILLEKERLP